MSKDRRKHRRLPLTLSIAKPIRIEMSTDQHEDTIPGILADLSAGGAAMIVFHRLPKESRIDFNLNFLGVKKHLNGVIVREEEKFDETFIVGIQFDNPSEELEDMIEDMAEDHDICEIRYAMNPETACFPDCDFRPLCGKRIKKDFEEERGEK
ncbi:MAG: PilZ domain-containing protein [Elusimicrobiota bacterium]